MGKLTQKVVGWNHHYYTTGLGYIPKDGEHPNLHRFNRTRRVHLLRFEITSQRTGGGVFVGSLVEKYCWEGCGENICDTWMCCCCCCCCCCCWCFWDVFFFSWFQEKQSFDLTFWQICCLGEMFRREDLIWEAHSVQFSPCGKYLLVRTPSENSVWGEIGHHGLPIKGIIHHGIPGAWDWNRTKNLKQKTS